MKQDSRNKIEAVIRTLDALFENRAIAGRKNVDMALGCAVVLERLLEDDKADNEKGDDKQ